MLPNNICNRNSGEGRQASLSALCQKQKVFPIMFQKRQILFVSCPLKMNEQVCQLVLTLLIRKDRHILEAKKKPTETSKKTPCVIDCNNKTANTLILGLFLFSFICKLWQYVVYYQDLCDISNKNLYETMVLWQESMCWNIQKCDQVL